MIIQSITLSILQKPPYGRSTTLTLKESLYAFKASDIEDVGEQKYLEMKNDNILLKIQDIIQERT